MKKGGIPGIGKSQQQYDKSGAGMSCVRNIKDASVTGSQCMWRGIRIRRDQVIKHFKSHGEDFI